MAESKSSTSEAFSSWRDWVTQSETQLNKLLNEVMAKDDLQHHTPMPYRHLCSRDVLTMERIEGVSVRELISALHVGDRERLDAWAARGITPRVVGRLLLGYNAAFALEEIGPDCQGGRARTCSCARG